MVHGIYDLRYTIYARWGGRWVVAVVAPGGANREKSRAATVCWHGVGPIFGGIFPGLLRGKVSDFRIECFLVIKVLFQGFFGRSGCLAPRRCQHSQARRLRDVEDEDEHDDEEDY